MNERPRVVSLPVACVFLSSPVCVGFYADFTDAAGETALSEQFRQQYQLAQNAVEASRSVQPFLELLGRCKRPEEVAELEMTIGVTFGQRTGLVDPAKAVVHFTNALEYELPEKAYIRAIMWRGNALEQTKKHRKALEDYLRGLLACSYHDLSGGWPEILPPTVPMARHSRDPEDVQRVRDYQRYRKRVMFQRLLLTDRYFFVEAVRRVQAHLSISDGEVLKTLEKLSPDASRHALVMNLLKSENERPWP